MTQTIVNLGTGGAALNGQNGSTAGADSNDALFLEWPGDNAGNYVYLPGVASNFLNVLDEAALDITGDIDIRVRVAMDDWTPSASSALLLKWVSTGDQRSFRFDLRTDGLPQLQWTETGAAATIRTATATAAPTISDGSVLWVRVTLDVDNGASGRDITFFTSDDGVTWTQLGSIVTQAGVTSIYSGTAGVAVDFGSAGKFYRAQILNGIGGTTVLDVDTSVITSGAATSFTAVTGQTVTINRSTSGRKSVAVVSPVWLFGTNDRIEVEDNALLDFGASDSFTVVVVRRQWATPANNGYWLGKRALSSPNAGYALFNNSTNAVAQGVLDDGPFGSFATRSYTFGSMSTIAQVIDRSAQTHTIFVDGVAGTLERISAIGSLTNNVKLTIGAFVSTAYQDFELLGVALFRRALTEGELTQITAYYQARLS